MAKNKANIFYFKWIGIGIMLILGLEVFQSNPDWVESIYSRGFYPLYSYLPKALFNWIPFSVGDLIYALLFVGLLYLFIKSIIPLFKRDLKKSLNLFLRFISILISIYIFFYFTWALNYYRQPIHNQLDIKIDTILLEDHLSVLNRHIESLNNLREHLNLSEQERKTADFEIETIMKNDSLFKILSKTHVKIKSPLIVKFASLFAVSGYFNPFSHEAHINKEMPLNSYPFTVAHELSHQMGIGFEDECNFIAFVKLKDHKNSWYSYAAYYESVNYLLRTLYFVDKKLFEEYKSKLSAQVIADIKADQEYWQKYSGWISDLSGVFYNQYLKHNNQAEGMARYGLVSRLIIAWEQKQ